MFQFRPYEDELGCQHTIKSHGAQLARNHKHDWLILILLVVIDIILNIIDPFYRFVGQGMMEDLRYPMKENTVPVWAVPIYAVLLPIFIFVLYYLRRKDVYDLHHSILGLLFAVLITGVLTDSIKDAVGRPRPDFFWRCFPDGQDVWSFAGLGFLALYLSGKIKCFDRRGHIAKLCILFLPILAACLVGVSRVDDYWHHWQDVFAGGLLGSGCYAYIRAVEETRSSRQPRNGISMNQQQQPQSVVYSNVNLDSTFDAMESGRRDHSECDRTISSICWGDMMTDLRYPLQDNTIPLWAVPLIAIMLPLAVILIFYFIRHDVYDLHQAILGLLFSVLITGVLTDAIKDAVGRPRPDFFWRCFPDGKGVSSVGDVQCTGLKSVIREGHKSFPSGHTSWSFAGLGFLAWYLSGKIRVFDRRGHIAKLCIIFVPLLLAALVGVSRVDDYWHHWQDVFAGGLLGITVASFCYLQFFPPPYDVDGWAPHAYLSMLGESQNRSLTTNNGNHLSVRQSEIESVYIPDNSNSVLQDMESGRRQ
ncbi:hypothetical protein RD792_015446 [Penstemon davidsonii]|uniref:Phosphatidic acid phosphatase type 2/haloperoxidase domain-containing protein n=1 Tax=Penstemon davidsonii TaxID=160366 RepID=A0ABR0CS76_9LAMI|nr:hypothetical protein RD792_015446 [Penstemon davidsonii]